MGRAYVPKPGETIHRTASEMVRLAKLHGCPIDATFNGIELTGLSDQEPSDVMNDYGNACYRRDVAFQEATGRKDTAFEEMKKSLKRAEKELLWASEQFEGGEVLRLAAAECRAALRLAEGASDT